MIFGGPVPHVEAATNSTLNFQGRLLDNFGGLVDDGDYNVQFNLYSVDTGGASLWTETRLVSGSQGVTVSDGYYSVYLGDVTAFPTTIDWDQEHWLGMTVRGTGSCAFAACTPTDAEMSPRFKLTAVPYAFRAGAVVDSAGNAYTGDDLAQLAPSSAQPVNAAVAALRIAQSGAGDLLQLQDGSGDVFTVTNTGATTIGEGITIGNSALTTAGTLRWTGTDFEGRTGAGWVSLTGGAGGSPFIQGGNAFGATAILGTTDTQGLEIRTDDVARLTFTSAGAATFSNGLTVSSGGLDLDGGNIVDAGNITGTGALTLASGGSSDLTLDSASGILVLDDATLRRSAAGTTTIDLLDSSAATTLSVSNSDGTQVANLDVEGTVTANQGVILGNNTGTTSGTIRWTGSDFEGYDGAGWVSLTSPGAEVINIAKASDEVVNNVGILQDDDDLTFAVGANETWTVDFVIQGQSGTTPDFRFAVNAPSGSTCQIGYSNVEYAAGVGQYGCGTTTNRVASSGADEVVRVSGTVTTGGTAGNITLQWSQFTANASDTIVRAGSYVRAVSENASGGGGGGSSDAFVQNGNAFGTTAIFGTTDTQGLEIRTDNAARLSFTSGGAATFSNALTVSSGGVTISAGGLTLTGGLDNNSGGITEAGAISGVTTISGTGAVTLSSGGSSDLTLNSASDVLALSDATLRRSAAGTTTFDLLDSSANTTLSLTNSDGTRVAGLTVEGDVTANAFSGDGSGLTGLDGSNITSGTIPDARLSANVALLNTNQTFTGKPTFSDGLIVGNTATTTAGVVRWNGTDFEGYDGTTWLSLTQSNAAAATNVVKTADEIVNNSNTLQNDDDLTFAVDANQVWSFEFVIQGQSNTTPDFRFAVTAPAGSTCLYGYENAENAQSNSQFSCGATTTRVGGTNNNEVYRVSGTVSTAGTAGNVTLQWAQFTADASDTIVRGGSYVNAREENGGSGGGGGSTTFDQGGNTFGATAVLGTSDNFGLNIVTNGSNAPTFTNGGVANFTQDTSVAGDLTANGNLFLGTLPTPDASAQAAFYTGAAANEGLVIQGASAQTANLLEFQDNSGNTLSGFNSSGALVLGDSTVSSTATVSRAISFPDEAGTVCLSGSDACGFLELATGSAYTDATTNDVLVINKTNATGDLLEFQRSGAPVFTVANTGALQVQASSSTALDIRNTGGTSYFSVDSSSGEVRVGPATADANGVLFVLDTKNTAPDPTGTDGAQYYNSNLGKFRCYQDGAWTDCIDDTPALKSFVDTTSDSVVDNNTTDYWDTAAENNNSYPIITPSSTTRPVFGIITVEFTSATTGNRDVIARVERNIGSAPTCGSGTVVGTDIGIFSTNTGLSKSGTISFLDSPATTSDVYYTVCSDSGTNNAGGMTVTEIRATLEEVENSN